MKELSSINIKKIENGFVLSADYRETETQSADKPMQCIPNKEHAFENVDSLIAKVKSLLGGKNDLKTDVHERVFKEKEEAEDGGTDKD